MVLQIGDPAFRLRHQVTQLHVLVAQPVIFGYQFLNNTIPVGHTNFYMKTH